ncbi:MAG: HAMP domain-containing histidine kinase, partial [Ignavibacteriae bacterium]|nr:HAMP domain-containing histidine kinase [Ignavibacteriota bacterium]
MKLTIYKKMWLGFGIIILLMLAANVYMISALRGVMSGTKDTFTYDMRAADLAKQMKAILYDEEPYAQKAAFFQDKDYFKVFEEQSKVFTQFADSIRSLGVSDNKVAIVHRVQESHAWFTEAVRRATFGSGRRGDHADENERSDTLDVLHAQLDQFIKLNQQAVQIAIGEINDGMVHSTNVAYFLTVGAFIAAIIAAVFITLTITKPIGVLIRGTEEIAKGKFAPIAVTTQDEMSLLAQAINDMSAKLESIDKLKTEMMHHISHELRTPLQAMTSALNLMTDQRYGTLNNEQLRLTSFIREGINKITAFSHQFLDISKIESGAMKYN